MPSLTGLDYRLHSLEREKDNCCCYWKYHITCINLICINGKCQYYEKTMLCKTTEVCSAEWLLKIMYIQYTELFSPFYTCKLQTVLSRLEFAQTKSCWQIFPCIQYLQHKFWRALVLLLILIKLNPKVVKDIILLRDDLFLHSNYTCTCTTLYNLKR